MSTSVFASVLGLLLISLIDETHSLDLLREGVPPFKHSVKSRTNEGDNNSITGRIINGSNATMNEYPWMAALFINRDFQCGGSIISDQFILTAAHCVEGLKAEDITASLGDHNLSNQSETESDIYHIEEIIMYEEYLATIFITPSLPNFGHQNHQNYFDDIALLKVNRNIQFSENVSPICLSKSEEKHIGEIATVTGWGETENDEDPEILKEAQVQVIDISKCKDEKNNSHSVISIAFNSATLCAEDVDGNAFHGDSGGPVVIKNRSNKWEQIGIVRGPAHCYSRQPAVYTRVSKFLNWIESKTEESFQNNC